MADEDRHGDPQDVVVQLLRVLSDGHRRHLAARLNQVVREARADVALVADVEPGDLVGVRSL